MEFGERQNPNQRIAGITFVVILHIILVYALINGLARKALELLPQPIETKIIKEQKNDEPPPPPPPPKFAPPPPPSIPPPEIDIQSTAPRANAITATTGKPVAAPAAPKGAATPPVVLARNCREPDYPAISERLGEVGTVVLQLLVGTDGKVTDSKVAKSSGFPRLDKAAVEALSLCKFSPGKTAEGTPVAAWAPIQYTFKRQ